MLKAPETRRDILPDLMRAFALIGIALVNVEMLSSSKMNGYGPDQLTDSFSQIAHFGVLGLFTLKSYSLFSLMFGVGLGYQLDAAHRDGVGLKGRYFRRLSGLFILGALHAIFLFIGDVLVPYALLGAILYLCRNMTQRALYRWGTALLIIQTLILAGAGLAYALVENMPSDGGFSESLAAQEEAFLAIDQVFANGSFLATAAERLSLWPDILLTTLFMVQGIAALGFFMIGLAMYRQGLISDPANAFWKRCRWMFLPLGLVLSLCGAQIYVTAETRASSQVIYGMTLLLAGSPLASLGYAGWLARIAQHAGPVLRFLARGGSASLTAYLLQSVLFCAVFLEFGLGLYQQTSAGMAVLIALAVSLSSLILMSIWQSRFRRGPIEILLRRWTYFGRMPANHP